VAPESTAPRAGSERKSATPAVKRRPGFVSIYAQPWAYVTVDGKKMGETPVMKLELPAGLHRVRLDHPQKRSYETAVSVTAGETKMIDVNLKP
jgi:serine/threonine-protein kinase